MASFYDTLRELDTLGRRRRGAALPPSDEARFQQLSAFFEEAGGDELPPNESGPAGRAFENAPAARLAGDEGSPLPAATEEPSESIEVAIEEPEGTDETTPTFAPVPSNEETFAPTPEHPPEALSLPESATESQDERERSFDVLLNLAQAQPPPESATGGLVAASPGAPADLLRPSEEPPSPEPAAASFEPAPEPAEAPVPARSEEADRTPRPPPAPGAGTAIAESSAPAPAVTTANDVEIEPAPLAPEADASFETTPAPPATEAPFAAISAASRPAPEPRPIAPDSEGADGIEVEIAEEDTLATAGGGPEVLPTGLQLESAPTPEAGELDIDVSEGLTPELAAWLAPPSRAPGADEALAAFELTDEPELPPLDVLLASAVPDSRAAPEPEGVGAPETDSAAWRGAPPEDEPAEATRGDAPSSGPTLAPAPMEPESAAVEPAPELQLELVPAAEDQRPGPAAQVDFGLEPAGTPAPSTAGAIAGEQEPASSTAPVPLPITAPEPSAEDAGLLDALAPAPAATPARANEAVPAAAPPPAAPGTRADTSSGFLDHSGTPPELLPPAAAAPRPPEASSGAEEPTIQLDARALSRLFPPEPAPQAPLPPRPLPSASGGAAPPAPPPLEAAEGQATMIRPALSLVRAQRDPGTPPEVNEAELLAFARGEPPPAPASEAWADPKSWDQPAPAEPLAPDPAWATGNADWPAPAAPEGWSAPPPPAPWETGAAGWSAPAPAAPTPSWSVPAGQGWNPPPAAPAWTAQAPDWGAPSGPEPEGPPSWMTPVAETLDGPPPAEDPTPAPDAAEPPPLASATDFLAEAGSANDWSAGQVAAWSPTPPPSMPARTPSSPPASARSPSSPPLAPRPPSYPPTSAARPPTHPPSAPPALAAWGAPAWEEPQPALVLSGEHRVVIHTLEGGVKRGIARDIDLGGSSIGLAQAPGMPPLDFVPFARAKAVFFMLPPGEKPLTATGRRVKVTFADGRQVEGILGEEIAQGFFLMPIEPRTSTARVYVLSHAVRQVT